MTHAAIDQPDAEAIREWAHEAGKLATAWGIAMTRDLPNPSSRLAALVLNEIRAYTSFLFRERVRKRFGRSVAESFDDAILSGHPKGTQTLAYREPAGNPRSSTRERPPPWTPGETHELVRAVRRDAARCLDFKVTPEMIQLFCETTGVHPGSFMGSGTSLASLAFYVVVFSMLTSEGRPTRWQMNQLLKKLKACREDLSAKLDALVPGAQTPTPSPLAPTQGLAPFPGAACLPPSAEAAES